MAGANERRPIDWALPLLGRSRLVRRRVLALPPQSEFRRACLRRLIVLTYANVNERGELPRYLHDDSLVVRQTSAFLDTAGTFVGPEGFRAMWGEQQEAFGELRFQPTKVIELSPDELLILLRFDASGGGSGLDATRDVAHRVTLGREHIARIEVFWDVSEALEAAGLRE